MGNQPDRAKKPLQQWPPMLNAAEHNYDTTQRELLAVFSAIPTPKLYRERQRFQIWALHDALKWISNLVDWTA